jgi:hypothetical protein
LSLLGAGDPASAPLRIGDWRSDQDLGAIIQIVPRTLLALVSLGLTLLALEAAFRALDIGPDFHGKRRVEVRIAPGGPSERAPFAFIPLATVRATYDSNPRGYFDPGNQIDHVHNSAGWRDLEHSIETPDATFRILGLGDSYLWGQGVRYQDIVLTRLGRALDGLADGITVETINTGISAFNTADERDLLAERGLAYDPDLVILFFVLNDVEPDTSRRHQPMIEFFLNYTAITQQQDRLSRYSHLWGWARQRVLLARRADSYIRQSITSFVEDESKWRQSRHALDDIHRMTRARDIPLLVSIFPFFHDLDGDYPFQIVHDVVRTYCESQGIAVIDLRDAYREYRGPELWVHPIDQHPNEIAHAVAAKAIVAYLAEHPELLPGYPL